MLPGVIKIDDLNRSRKVQVGESPNPDRAIGQDNFGFRPAPNSAMRFAEQTASELFGPLNGSAVSRCIGILDRTVFRIQRRLREHATQFDLAGMSRFARSPSFRPAVSAATMGTPVPSI